MSRAGGSLFVPCFVVPLFRFALNSSGQVMENCFSGLEGLKGSHWTMPAVYVAIFADEDDYHDGRLFW